MTGYFSKLIPVLCALFSASGLFAGSLDYLSNQSARYAMTFSRNAATDAADIVAYNPAGTALLPQGLSIDISNQTLIKPYEQEYSIAFDFAPYSGYNTSETVQQNEPTWLLPNIFAVYSFGETGIGKAAAYFQAGIVAGGGTLKYDDGTTGSGLTLVNILQGKVLSQYFEASSVYYAIGLGASCAILNDMVSFSLGGKAVYADRGMILKGSSAANNISVDYEYTALGFTPVLGINVKPVRDLNIGIRYEYETGLEFKYKEKKLGGTSAAVTNANNLLGYMHISDGAKLKQNLPQILALGVEYAATPEMALMSSVNFYFLNCADLGAVYNKSSGSKIADLNEYFGMGYELSLGATYLLMKELKAGAGFLYTESGAKGKYFETSNTALHCSANPPLDSIGLCAGATYTVYDMDITAGILWTHYLPQKFDYTETAGPGHVTVEGEYKKDVIDIALGLSRKW